MKIAISCGDLNGISLELLLRTHKKIKHKCKPIYCIDKEILAKAAELLDLKLPKSIECQSPKEVLKNAPNSLIDPSLLQSLDTPSITPSTITKESGLYSYLSFLSAIYLTQTHITKALVTLPIHKKAWQLANIPYAGHTECLRGISQKLLIMVLGNPKLFVALFSDHIPLSQVPSKITLQNVENFLLQLAPHISKTPCGVLGLNPHAGDFGVLGNEDLLITQAIVKVNQQLKQEVFRGALVPDTAFIGLPYRFMVAMYHDQGLIPLKTLFFDKSINVTFGLPFIRTSPDHGTAFDKAYQKRNAHNKLSLKSYKCAIDYAINTAK